MREPIRETIRIVEPPARNRGDDGKTHGHGHHKPKPARPGHAPVREQTEVLSLIGDIALEERGGRKVHAHVVLGKRDGAALGGHLLAAKVRPTLEVVLDASPGCLKRRHDPASGLSLIKID